MSVQGLGSGGSAGFGAVLGRVADGFHWADQMDALYGKGDSLFQKAAFTSADAGINNRAFGQVLWQQANVKTPLVGMLPDMVGENAPGQLNDPRSVSFRAAFNPPSKRAPEEAGVWGDSKKFDTREVNLDPRHSTMRFESSLIQQLLADIQDGVPFENLTQIGEDYFQRSLEVDGIARPVESSDSTNGGTGTQYENSTSITSLDRVIASADEEANADDPSGVAFADGDLDVYDIDRSATGDGGRNEANWSDAVVDHNSANGDRQLTDTLVNGVIQGIEDNGGSRENLVIFTGHDTARVLSELRESQMRFSDMVNAASEAVGRGSGEGTETRMGAPVNTQISSWDSIPIVAGPNCPSDSLSRIYFLDMTTMNDPVTGENVPKLGIETYIPMTVETAGLGQPTNTLATGELKDEVGVLTTHQVRVNRPNHQGKLRDLSE